MASNTLQKAVNLVNKLPVKCRPFALSLVMGRVIKFAGTAKIHVATLNPNECVVSVKNRRKVQNHIGSVHAAAIALIAESATGFMAALSVPDNRIIVLKSMSLQYIKRASGDMTASASFSGEQILFIESHDKGDITVPIRITDGNGDETATAQIIWAWTLKKH